MFLDTYDEVQLSFIIRMRIVYQGCVVLLWRLCGWNTNRVVRVSIRRRSHRCLLLFIIIYLYFFNFFGRIEVTTD